MPKKKKRFALFPAYTDKYLIIAMTFLFLFGTLMIISTEMGLNAGEQSIVFSLIRKQSFYFLIGLAAIFVASRTHLTDIKMKIMWGLYYAVLASLLATRLFTPKNGAYAWIELGGFSFQPSELAKVFILILGAKLLGYRNIKDIKKNFWTFAKCTGAYVAVILLLQKDLGSAVILFGMAYIMALIPASKELKTIQKWMLIFVGIGLVGVVFVLSPLGTKFFNLFSDNYMAGRFLASADPFAYQYSSGYHLIMGLIAFSSGGWFGVGLGQSIHKYMNFPNPSNDFILPIIVEELGFVFGLLPILIGYGVIFWRLIKNSLDTQNIASKMIFVGTFAYFALHFILNVGGVSGIIPLTGVPLLLISRGGSSLFCIMAAIGLCEGEVIYNKKREKEKCES